MRATIFPAGLKRRTETRGEDALCHDLRHIAGRWADEAIAVADRVEALILDEERVVLDVDITTGVLTVRTHASDTTINLYAVDPFGDDDTDEEPAS